MEKCLKDRWLFALIVIIAILMPFVLYWDLWIKDQVFLSGDGLAYLAPRVFQKEALLSGEFPLWNKFLNNGIPFIADTGMAPLYLPSIILSFLPIKFFVFLAYGVHVAIAGVFAARYFIAIGCKSFVATVGAILYMLSIHFGGVRKEHLVIITSVVYFPVIIYYIESYFITNDKKQLLYSIAFLSLQFLGPFIQISAYSFGIASLYFFLRAFFFQYDIKKNAILWMKYSLLYVGLVMVQLLPTLELIKYYRMAGIIPTAIEYFKTYSISFDKLVMLVFPKWFNGNIYFAGGVYKSSGIDIEVFGGICFFSIFLFAVLHMIKDRYMKLFISIMVLAFIYAAHANIPFLSRILFMVPGINGFRCPARILFVFIFFAYTVFTYGLNNIILNDNTKFSKYLFWFTVSVISVSILRTAWIVRVKGDYFQTYSNLFLMQVIAIVSFFVIIKILRLYCNVRTKQIVVLSFILVVSLAETHNFYTVTGTSKVEDVSFDNKLGLNIDTASGSEKVWDAFPYIDGGHKSYISQNSGMLKKTASINAYIPFNNPYLYRMFTSGGVANFNYSGLTTGSIFAAHNLHLQNNMLSMLGIKYIIDSNNILLSHNYVQKIEQGKRKLILEKEKISVPVNTSVNVINIPIILKSNSVYKVEFNYDLAEYPQHFLIDFYGGASYDDPALEFNAYRGMGINHVVKFLNTSSIPKNIDVYLRIITQNSKPIDITKLRVTECKSIWEKDVYKKIGNINGGSFYENPYYKGILYTVPNIKPMKLIGTVYGDLDNNDFLSTSYVEKYDRIITDNDAEISDIHFRYNDITAKVKSKNGCFVNFSQNYFPGWNAYVNGNKVQNYFVNGLTQGAQVPKGENILQFKYEPIAFKIGGIISLLTACIFIFALYQNKKE